MPESPEDRLSELESLWYEVVGQFSEGLVVAEQAGRTTVSCPNCKRVVEVGIATA